MTYRAYMDAVIALTHMSEMLIDSGERLTRPKLGYKSISPLGR